MLWLYCKVCTIDEVFVLQKNLSNLCGKIVYYLLMGNAIRIKSSVQINFDKKEINIMLGIKKKVKVTVLLRSLNGWTSAK